MTRFGVGVQLLKNIGRNVERLHTGGVEVLERGENTDEWLCQTKDHGLFCENGEPQKDFKQVRCDQGYDPKDMKTTLLLCREQTGTKENWNQKQ